MATWDSADCLRRFLRESGLPDTNEEDATTELYPLLTTAHNTVIREIATRYPHCLYNLQGPTALTPAADNKTFSFGTDGNGNAIMPMGWVQIAPRLSAFSGDYSYFWREGVDFLDEGTRIRIPSDRAYSGTLYARYIATPPNITAAVNPVLQPADARQLIIIKAVEDWAGEGNRRPDLVDRMERKWAKDFPVWMLAFRRRFRGGGAMTDPAQWYLHSPDLTN